MTRFHFERPDGPPSRNAQNILVPLNEFVPPQGYGSGGIVPPTGDLLLDIHPGARCAYSLRELNTSYNGPAIRVRRTSDSMEQDIGFLNHNLDIVSLLDFVGVSDGRIRILYDQSGNGFDLDAQGTDNRLPKIVVNGILQTSDGTEAILFDGVNDILFSTESMSGPVDHLFIFGIWQKLSTGNQPINFTLNFPDTNDRVSVHAPSDDIRVIFDAGGTGDNRVDTTQDGNGSNYNDTSKHHYSFIKTGGIDNLKINRDQTNIAKMSVVIPGANISKIGIGAFRDDTLLLPSFMKFQELVFYDINVLDDVAQIESDMVDYWMRLPDGLFLNQFPPIGNTAYNNYKFYQVNQGEFQNETNNLIWEITDTVGPIFANPNGDDIRVFSQDGSPLSYEITFLNFSTGEFTIKILNPSLKDLDFIQIIFGNASAVDGSTVLGAGITLSTFESPLLTNNVPTLLGKSGDWFDVNYLSRIPTTINSGQVPTTQTDFPMLINSTFSDLIGKNINELRFAGIDGIQLDYEIVEFNSITGKLIVWIKMLTISDGDNIYIYYDNPAAVDAQNKAAVWSDYKSVLHMDPSLVDSTGNTTPINTGTIDVEGKIARAREFNGLNTFLNLGNFNLTGNTMTLSAWIKNVNRNTLRIIIGKPITLLEPPSYKWALMQNFSNPLCRVSFNVITSGSLVIGTFSKIDAVYDGTKIIIYLHGISQVDFPKTENIELENTDVIIGGTTEASTEFFDGVIDEVRILNVARSPDWLLTEYNNQNAPETFYSISSKESLDEIFVENTE